MFGGNPANPALYDDKMGPPGWPDGTTLVVRSPGAPDFLAGRGPVQALDKTPDGI